MKHETIKPFSLRSLLDCKIMPRCFDGLRLRSFEIAVCSIMVMFIKVSHYIKFRYADESVIYTVLRCNVSFDEDEKFHYVAFGLFLLDQCSYTRKKVCFEEMYTALKGIV